MSADEISEAWRVNRDTAARKGTWMHWRFEAYLNRAPIPEEGLEFQLFREYLGTLRGLAAFRTEWTIFAEAEWLAGSIDFVAKDVNGHLVLFDWKRSKGLSGKYTNRHWDEYLSEQGFPGGDVRVCSIVL